jgi:hypothetical protein
MINSCELSVLVNSYCESNKEDSDHTYQLVPSNNLIKEENVAKKRINNAGISQKCDKA